MKYRALRYGILTYACIVEVFLSMAETNCVKLRTAYTCLPDRVWVRWKGRMQDGSMTDQRANTTRHPSLTTAT